MQQCLCTTFVRKTLTCNTMLQFGKPAKQTGANNVGCSAILAAVCHILLAQIY